MKRDSRLSSSSDWRLAPTPKAAEKLRNAGLPPRLAELLARRGVEEPSQAEAFLFPSADQLHDPFLLAGMSEAVERLALARERREAVAVVGDYDVDGVTATALLLGVLGACGIEAHPVLPHRLREGYGFQPLHVERAVELGCRLIVTVDCGVSAGAAVARAREAGIDVVVTDHHLPGEGLPGEAVVINPRQPGCSYPFLELSGVGLALKLAVGLARRLERRVSLHQLLRMACLGTIADVVPLVGENRTIAVLGLQALAHTRSAGLQALLRRAGLRSPLTAEDVGFRIGPRLNAAGRLASPERALDLLLCRDPARAEALAEELERCNRARQEEDNRVVEEARLELATRRPLPPLALACREGWHRGVVGIAAGRLAREMARPVVLLAAEGDLATGSGRSVPGIDLHAFLAPYARRFERFGGHAQAVGLTVDRRRLPELQAELEEAAAAWPPELLRRRYEYELELVASEVTAELAAELRRLAPHGPANPQPLLRLGPLRLAAAPRRFGRDHLAARAAGEDGAPISLVGWGWAGRSHHLAGRFEALGTLEEDAVRRGPVLRLADARPAP